MSTIVKERLKKLLIELEKEERAILDNALVTFTSKPDCDSAIESISDAELIKLTNVIIKRRKKKKKSPELVTNCEPLPAE